MKRKTARSINLLLKTTAKAKTKTKKRKQIVSPIVLSTWDIGVRANNKAWTVLEKGGTAIDAVEQGVSTIEDEINCCVGLDGIPDATGRTTLDASIMDGQLNCGSVAFLERIRHPVSVARRVMESTSHVMLVGEGAQSFAVQQGFPLEDVPKSNIVGKTMGAHDNIGGKTMGAHDTIGTIAMDATGRFAGACSSSGLPAKMRGRVGDSAIIGSGLYVDDTVGAVVATGNGEDIIRISGASTVIEGMRAGMTPEQACRFAINKLVKGQPHRDFVKEDIIVAFIAINKDGKWGSYSLRPGVDFAVRTATLNKRVKSKHILKK